MARKRRADQREGYVFEEYQKASSIVERLKVIAERMADPQKEALLADLARKAKNQRGQAQTRLNGFDTMHILSTEPGLDEKTQKKYREQRDKLAGEILIRVYHIHMANETAKRILGA